MTAYSRNNPTLDAWMREYDEIAREFIENVRDTGVTFGKPYVWEKRTHELLEQARNHGATFRNGSASIVSGRISEACVACSNSLEDKTFSFSLKCHRNCYFCFNPNQEGYERMLVEDEDWRSDMEEMDKAGSMMTHLALTGGEPLLRPQECIAFFAKARELWPAAHTRLYTTGDQLTETLLTQLVEAGLNEIRFSVKPEETDSEHQRILDIIRMACDYADLLKTNSEKRGATGEAAENRIPPQRYMSLDVMVEMPVIPGSFNEMCRLLDELEAMGAFGINLLEFCYPFNNWHEFAARGLKIKNPPYPVMYNYEYAGSLPIEGSEEECLKLVNYALEKKLKLGVHYCSLENKHRSQIQRQNQMIRFEHPCYEMDADDFFFKTVKVFGCDVDPVLSFLERALKGLSTLSKRSAWIHIAEDGCLQFHPRFLKPVLNANLHTALGDPVSPVMSVNILERQDGDVVLRELALIPIAKL